MVPNPMANPMLNRFLFPLRPNCPKPFKSVVTLNLLRFQPIYKRDVVVRQLSLMFPTRNSRLLRFHDLNISRHTQKFMPVDFFLASASVRAFPTSSESNRRYVMDSVIRNTNVILTQFVKSIYLFFPPDSIQFHRV